MTKHRLKYLFAEEEVLGAAYNDADQAAEDAGLKQAFAAATERVIREPIPPSSPSINRRLVHLAYCDVWVPMARGAFEEAIANKEAKPRVPTLKKDDQGNLINLGERSSASDYQWNIEWSIGILNDYRESFERIQRQELDYVLSSKRMSELEREFRP